MSIIPGTTPTLTLSLDKSITGCTAAEFCLACGTVRILRPLSELSLSADGTEVSLRLTQTETLMLPDNQIAKIAEQNQQIFGYQLAASQAAQNNYLVSTLRPSPNPAYVVANPYCCNSYNSGYGYGCAA